MKILQRTSNTINLASFWENVQLKKYNFDPSYQRQGNVWNDEKKSFLMDTIMKNFPMPPIFLHQHIEDASGKTIYDVIDGKQRLTAIIEFITDKVFLPEDFSTDGFGDVRLNGLKFSDLESDEYMEWKRNFWRYELTIEYIDTQEAGVINNIFDRLNRNGMPLTPQELRKAKYNNTVLYSIVKTLSDIVFWRPFLDRLERNRLEDHEFISELLFVVLENQIFASDNSLIIDELYEKYTGDPEKNIIALNQVSFTAKFTEITSIIENLGLDFKGLKIEGVSHLYGLWGFAWYIHSQGLYTDSIKQKVQDFYAQLRARISNEHLENYRVSMSAGTKSRARRIRRINALLGFCGFQSINE